MPLLKNQLASGERIVKTVSEGVTGAKRSLTRYRILERFCQSTLVEAQPVTGERIKFAYTVNMQVAQSWETKNTVIVNRQRFSVHMVCNVYFYTPFNLIYTC